ncbi:unnamed protein product [Protopolystoma xenopodis]|uniref:Uncharacterized protein n=1 Tax=Protopolystoma xenopodis TaxID=117903 RepID=A0A3S5C0Y3_9PLAT|nr:unnamed protein product [Protopolystoma xenopodis]
MGGLPSLPELDPSGNPSLRISDLLAHLISPDVWSAHLGQPFTGCLADLHIYSPRLISTNNVSLLDGIESSHFSESFNDGEKINDTPIDEIDLDLELAVMASWTKGRIRLIELEVHSSNETHLKKRTNICSASYIEEASSLSGLSKNATDASMDILCDKDKICSKLSCKDRCECILLDDGTQKCAESKLFYNCHIRL